MAATLSTSQIAKQAGVNLESIRFYERQGLLPKPPRTVGGYRMFTVDDVRRVRFIKRAQELGFTLKEVKGLLGLRLQPDTACADVRRAAEAKLADIEQKIAALRRMKTTLGRLAKACPGRGTLSNCPILESLDSPIVSIGGSRQGRMSGSRRDLASSGDVREGREVR